ncbi:MAG: penicillin-binding protein 2 [Treponema sp.]|jgi:penicillin-binding protein 2|nr:penicillin-binding protein 2 [Treponema sp.]
MSAPFLDSPDAPGEKSARRILVLRLLFIAIFAVYALRLFNMQVTEGAVYLSRAQNIARRTSVLPPQRGEIFDRDFASPLAQNEHTFAVSFTPGEIPGAEVPEVLARLGGIMQIPLEQIERRVPPTQYQLYQPIEIASNVSYATVAALSERADLLPGVTWQSKPMRTYPGLGSLSHIIGYMGNITRDELTMLYNKGYHEGDLIGKAGVEKEYDELLRGKEGHETRTVDARGRRVSGDSNQRVAPETGKNLVLTIDRRIQTLAEKALGKRMGAVVVLRPATGEVLAMVSYPWYDPNIFTRPRGGEYSALLNDPNKPLLNRAIQSNYPPASTFKVIMTTGILNESSFPQDRRVECQGEMDYGQRLWRCHIRKPGHGRLNLQQAMAQSCDIYFWNVGRDYLGVERIVNYAADFGFGELSGIDLPGEIPGLIPTPQWKERRLHERWLGGDTMNMSIGQGYTLVTPIQMADMVAMVVNNGTIYVPHILKEVRDPQSGEVLESIAPQVLHKSDIAPGVFETVRRNMRSVISEGTARYPLNIRSVEIAGKTGTGEVGLQNRWHSWFAAYAPYRTDKPEERVVVSIIVEAVNDWEWWATYASAIIFQGIFARQNYDDAVTALGFESLGPIQGRRE